MVPDEQDASMSGPPPRTWPWMRRLSTFPVTVIVTGCTESIAPELVRASRSNAASEGSVIEMLPDEE
jgi:hypothetical protein